jgi:hypothetical protein
MSEPPCVRQDVPRAQTEGGVTVLAGICWAASAQRRCYPTLYLPTCSHLLNVNELSLSSRFGNSFFPGLLYFNWNLS